MKDIISPYYTPGQREILETIRPILRLATSSVRGKLNLATRTHTLIAGPSGSGKSYIARALSKETRLPLWESNVSSWIVLGSRAGKSSLADLVDWIHTHPKGIIFLDELDKPFPNSNSGNMSVSQISSSDWINAIRMEIHDILDARIPAASIQVDESSFSGIYYESFNHTEVQALVKADVERKLRTSFLVLGAGTWQHVWRKKGNAIGFVDSVEDVVFIDHHKLANSINPEILLRFRNKVMFIRPMTQGDFYTVLRDQLTLIPTEYRHRFKEMVHIAIPKALEYGLGMRVFEEIYTDLCCEIIQNCAGDEEESYKVFFGR